MSNDANDRHDPLTDPLTDLTQREDRIFGVVDDPATDVPKLMADLLALDVDVDSVQVYRGRRGLDKLSPNHDDQSWLARIKRTVQRIGYEGEYLELVERELTAGHALVAVEVDEEYQVPVIRAMKEHGAHDMHRYGKLTIVNL